MKKIIVLIMVLILTLTISGCDGDLQYTEPPQDDWPHTVKYAFCSKNGNYSKPYCVEFWTEYDLNEGKIIDGYYTQEEVAEMYNIQQGYIDDLELRIEELELLAQENWQQMEDTQEWCEDITTDTECYEIIEWYAEHWDEVEEVIQLDQEFVIYDNCDMEEIFIMFFSGFKNITVNGIEGTYDLEFSDNEYKVYYIVDGQVAVVYSFSDFVDEYCVEIND